MISGQLRLTVWSCWDCSQAELRRRMKVHVRLSTKELNKQVSAAQELVERYDVWTTCVYDSVFPNRMPPEGKVAMEWEHENGSQLR